MHHSLYVPSLKRVLLDSSGLPETAGDYEKALEARKLLSASVSHGKSHQLLEVQQLTQQSGQRALLAMCA